MPDENDIVFDSYGPDLVQIISNSLQRVAEGDGIFSGLVYWLLNIWEIYSIFAFIASFIFIVGIIYSYIRFNQLSEIEMNRLLELERQWQEVYGEGKGDNQWHQVQKHIESINPNDWKLAIIEADIMLDKVLKDAGYAGNTVGERLKSASPVNFTTLQDAWDAHVIRNKIAHEGSDFIVTQRIAREAIIKYQRVFSEFGVM